MNVSQACASMALAATLVLMVLLVNRPPGSFVDVTVFVYAAIAYAVAWVFTVGALRVVPGLPFSAVLLLHLVGGALGVLGIFFVLSHDAEWWGLPCATLATVLPLVVNASVFAVSWPPVLVAVVALQAASVVLFPAGYVLRTVRKARAGAAYNRNWNEELHERSNHIPSNATIEQYFHFVVEPRHLGIAEHAARLLGRREDHEAMLIAALGAAAKKAIASLPAGEGEWTIAQEVGKRFQ